MAMTQEIGKLLVRLTGDSSQFTKTLNQAVTQATSFGIKMSASLTAPLTAMGAVGVREFSKFDHAMTQSTSIMDVTSKQMERMRDTALDLAQKGTQAPEELARSYFFLASAGLDAEKSIAALPQLQKFATAGAFDMATATDLLTDAQSALGMAFEDAMKNQQEMVRLSDVLVRANILANSSVRQFSTALTSKAGAALRTVNKDVEEGVAILGVYANAGIKAELAGNNLSRLLLLLQKNAVSNADAFRKYGFEVFDAEGKMRNLADIVANMETVLGGLSDSQRASTLAAMGFRAEIQGAILPLIGASDQIRQYEKDLRSAGGATDEVANKQMASFANQMQVTANYVRVAAIAIGEVLAPYILALNEGIRSALTAWSNMSAEAKKTITIIGMVVAGIGPLILQIVFMTKVMAMLGISIGALFSPVTLVIAAIGGMIALLAQAAGGWDKLIEHAKNFVISTIGFLANFQHNMFSIISWLSQNWWQLFVEMLDIGKRSFIGLVRAHEAVMRILWRSALATLGWISERMQAVFSIEFVNWVRDGVIKAAKALQRFAQQAYETLRNAFTGRAFSMNEFIAEMGKEMEAGAKAANLGETIANIISEELGGIENPFADFVSQITAPKLKFGLEREWSHQDTWKFLVDSAKSAWSAVSDFFADGSNTVADHATQIRETLRGMNSAIRAGSDEFFSMLDRIQPAAVMAPAPAPAPVPQAPLPGVLTRASDAGAAIVNKLSTLVSLAEEEARKRGFTIDQANLDSGA